MNLRASHCVNPILQKVVKDRFDAVKKARPSNPNSIRGAINNCIKPLRGYCKDAVIASVKSQLLEEYRDFLNCCDENNSGIDL